MGRRKQGGKPALALVGQTFGRLTVDRRGSNERRVGRRGQKSRWWCVCECGNYKLVLGEALMAGAVRSCGCLRSGATSTNWKHGSNRNRIYRIWRSMLARCGHLNPDRALAAYAGRGIRVCPEWHEFEAFQAWSLANGYRHSKSIDRIDNDGGYSPDNCRWATHTQQQNNKRSNRTIVVRGTQYTLAEASRKFGLCASTIKRRMSLGCSAEEAVKKVQFTRRRQQEIALAA